MKFDDRRHDRWGEQEGRRKARAHPRVSFGQGSLLFPLPTTIIVVKAFFFLCRVFSHRSYADPWTSRSFPSRSLLPRQSLHPSRSSDPSCSCWNVEERQTERELLLFPRPVGREPELTITYSCTLQTNAGRKSACPPASDEPERAPTSLLLTRRELGNKSPSRLKDKRVDGLLSKAATSDWEEFSEDYKGESVVKLVSHPRSTPFSPLLTPFPSFVPDKIKDYEATHRVYSVKELKKEKVELVVSPNLTLFDVPWLVGLDKLELRFTDGKEREIFLNHAAAFQSVRIVSVLLFVSSTSSDVRSRCVFSQLAVLPAVDVSDSLLSSSFPSFSTSLCFNHSLYTTLLGPKQELALSVNRGGPSTTAKNADGVNCGDCAVALQLACSRMGIADRRMLEENVRPLSYLFQSTRRNPGERKLTRLRS